MRKGQNPAKMGLPAYQAQELGVATITYIPNQEGYFRHSLDILKLELRSLRANTPVPFDLLVFDNGSAPEVQSELSRLEAAGEIDWLILSRHNQGKTGALNWILSSLPNSLVMVTDSDVYFRPGWYEASLELLDGFPQAGLVTAQPCFFDILRGEGSAHLRLDPAQVQTGQWMPDVKTIWNYYHGIGDDDRANHPLAAPLTTLTRRDQDLTAVLGASHMQFLARMEVVRQVLPLPATMGLSRDEDRELDMRIDRAGYLHLSTLAPLVFHMGNQLDVEIREEARALPAPATVSRRQPVETESQGITWRLLNRLAGLPFLRRQLSRLYNALFEILAEKS